MLTKISKPKSNKFLQRYQKDPSLKEMNSFKDQKIYKPNNQLRIQFSSPNTCIR